MILAVSSEAVALAGVVSGAVVGLVGTLVGILNTRMARGYEREARVWEARSRAYERLLWYAHRTMLDAERTYPLEEPAWGETLGMLPDSDYLEITAAVAAYGSRRVLRSLEDFSARSRDFFARAKKLEEIEKRGGAKVDRVELERLREEARTRLEQLDELVRAELEHREPESPSAASAATG